VPIGDMRARKPDAEKVEGAPLFRIGYSGRLV
jgi:hypothetical protein